MLAAFAGPDLLSRCYAAVISACSPEVLYDFAHAAVISAGYLWHEFGDVHLLLP